jgi:hypothetical protein
MAELPQSVRARLEQPPPAEHPDADLLTAFCEDAVTPLERERLLAHLAGCARCREITALAMPDEGPPPLLVLQRKPALLKFPVLRWGALAAAAVVVISAALLHHPGTQIARVEEHRTIAGSAAGPAQAAQSQPSAVPAPVAPSAVEPGKAASHYQPKKTAPAPATYDSLGQMALLRAPARRLPPALGVHGPAVAMNQQQGNAFVQQQTQPLLPAGAAKAEGGAIVHVTGAASGTVEGNDQSANLGEVLPTRKVQDIPLTDNSVVGVAQTLPGKGKKAKRGAAPGSAVAGLPQQAPAWSISPEGKLTRSLGGAAPQVIEVAPDAVLHAVASVGSQVWAGGNGGRLYHSVDGGTTWNQVALPKAQTIVSIQFKNVTHGVIRTADGLRYSTSNAGQSWKQIK